MNQNHPLIVECHSCKHRCPLVIDTERERTFHYECTICGRSTTLQMNEKDHQQFLKYLEQIK